MDVSSGYFARLEYTTDSQWSVPLVKDIAILARNAVGICSQGSGPALNQSQDHSTGVEQLCEPEVDGEQVSDQVRPTQDSRQKSQG